MQINVEIRPIIGSEHRGVHKFQCGYLDGETYEEFLIRVKANPALYLVAYDGNELAGICYGYPSDRVKAAVNLQGIAVNLDPAKGYARKGIGSTLLRSFERVVLESGYAKIDVGSADDLKVEHFYLKNGFIPYELVAKGANHEEYERVPILDYNSGKVTQAGLREKHHSKEVIFIFQKVL